MFFVATQNFRTVDRVLDRPTSQAAGPLRAVAHDPLRMLLRHLSSELNRLYFLTWGGAQLVLGVTLFWTLRGKDRILAGAMLLMTAVEAGAKTAQLCSRANLGRAFPKFRRPVEVLNS